MNNQKPSPTASKLNELLAAKDLEAKAVKKLEQCVKASLDFYYVEGDKVVRLPDFKTKLGAIQIALAYTEGKPVERREILQRTFTSLEVLRDKVQNSPELRRALTELLDGPFE